METNEETTVYARAIETAEAILEYMQNEIRKPVPAQLGEIRALAEAVQILLNL